MRTTTFRAIALVSLTALVMSSPVYAQAVGLEIVSSGAWRTSDSFETGWQTTDFDDSAWANARAPYPSDIVPADLIPGTTAQFIWHDPDSTSDGQTGPVQAYLRVSFDLDLVSANGPLEAMAEVSVDDDYDLYVNGLLVFENHDGGFAGVVDTIDIASSLRHGTNVIAIHGFDGSWDNPRDRGYERVLFDSHIATLARIIIPILSSGDWRSSATLHTDWETPDFDDSAWPFARAPYPGSAAATLIPDTSAQAIWHDPGAVSDGTSGPNQAWFRYAFNIPADAASLPVVGQMRINVDDDYELFVNGYLVLQNHDGGFSDQVQQVDFTWALRAGANVIAIHAVDGEWGNPYNRGGERVIADGLVATGLLDWDFVGIATMLDDACIVGPTLDKDTIAFVALAPFADCVTPAVFSTAGVYAVDVPTRAVDVVAQAGMAVPGGSGVFAIEYAYQRATVDGANIAFRAAEEDTLTRDIIGHGVFARIGGILQPIATTATAIPSGSGNFTDLAPRGPAIDGSNVVFHGSGGAGQAGVYSNHGGTLHALADLNTAIPPGSLGLFQDFGRGPDLHESGVAFAGCSAAVAPCYPGDAFDGIYVHDDDSDTLAVIADSSTQMPGAGGDDFEVFYYQSYKDGQVAFSGRGGAESGVYRWHEGSLSVVADNNTSIPDGSGLFSWWDFLFVHPSTDAGNVAFSVSERGVYTDLGGSLTEVIAYDEVPPDIFPLPFFFESPNVDPEGLSGNSIAFLAKQHGGADTALIVAVDAFGFAGDSDGDGVADNADNCVLHANSAQGDSNGDGYGNACDPDLTGDGSVNFLDLQKMEALFFSADASADLNRDGIVNFADLAIMKQFFFGSPGPSAFVD